MNIIVKCAFAACAVLFSGSTISADQCGTFDKCGNIVPMERKVIETWCATKACPVVPKPYCPPARVICYTCPSSPEYSAYWEQQDNAMANDVINVRGAPSPSQTEQWEKTGFNDNGNRTGGAGSFLNNMFKK